MCDETLLACVCRDHSGRCHIDRPCPASLQEGLNDLLIFLGGLEANRPESRYFSRLMETLIQQGCSCNQVIARDVHTRAAGLMALCSLPDQIVVFLAQDRLADAELNNRRRGAFNTKRETIVVSEPCPGNDLRQVERAGLAHRLACARTLRSGYGKLRRAFQRETDGLRESQRDARSRHLLVVGEREANPHAQ